MQIAQFGPGVHTEFVGQRAPDRGEGGQGVGLPTGAVEGEHALRPEPFDERVLGEQRTELGEGTLGPSDLQQRLHAQVGQLEPELGQLLPDRPEPPGVGHLRVRLPPPQRQHGGRPFQYGLVFTGRHELTDLRDCCAQLRGVDRGDG